MNFSCIIEGKGKYVSVLRVGKEVSKVSHAGLKRGTPKDRIYGATAEMLQENDNFDELLARKEQEWKSLQTQRIQSLVTTLQDTQVKLKEEQEKFNILKEDFMFNLRVLEERDRDLERYDAVFAQLKVTESCKQAEISELQIEIDKLQNIVAKEMKTREELQFQYQQQLKAHQLEIEKIRSSKDSKINGQQEEYAKLKQELERKVQEVEGQLALQKQELLAEFDAEMRHREHDFTLRRDEMNNVVLSNKLKVKLLSKELELLQETGTKAAESLQTAEKTNHQMAKQLQRKEFELKNVIALKDARIKELEDKINRMKVSLENEEEMFQRKHSELDRLARERDAKLATVKQVHTEQIRELNNKIRDLQISLETVEMEKRRMEWSHIDATKEKEDVIEKLRAELSTMKVGWDGHIAQISKETVAKDIQIKMLQEQDSKLRAEMARHKEDVEKYKHQLVQAVERERGLEQMKVQAELDWQQRCEEIERRQYLKSEELIQSLSQARDQVTAELQEKERKLQEVETLVQALTLERDQAIAALQKHGVIPERDSQLAKPMKGAMGDAEFPSDIIQNLQQQNINLRTVITQMRKEMEILSEQIPANQSTGKLFDDTGSLKSPQESSKDFPALEYTKSLEDEVHELKQKCRKLEEQLEDMSKDSTKIKIQPSGFSVTADNAYLQNHTRTLNETIAGLRAEKISTAATAKKYEARIVHLDSLVTQLTQQTRQKQVETNQLRYELTSQQQRTGSEMLRLNERIAELELQLTEAHKEADEYFKGNLQQNLETVALGNEVSALKLDLASGRVPVVVEQDELVKELQGEILQLRKQLIHSQSSNHPSQQQSSKVLVLRSKLKQAAHYISQLSRDKQQLIEIGNRLRAELVKSGLSVSQPSVTVSHLDLPTQLPRELAEEAQNRLSALEHLQYQLTTQELQYAQLTRFKKVPITVQQSSSESENGQNTINGKTGSEEQTADKGRAVGIAKITLDKAKECEFLEAGQSHSLTSEHSQSQPLMQNSHNQSEQLMSSYGADSSIQDVWKMLEGGLSPSVSTPQSNAELDDNADGGIRSISMQSLQDNVAIKKAGMDPRFTVRGSKAEVQIKTKPYCVKGTGTKQKHSTKTAKIRNYNLRD
ncbi:coiled-coil domain-containing protein 57 isoform X2 [Hemitrygon akajei]|uniref:coiled-coil domain-containing protein 57 isoform X2 n=1 Tax=Hemitrygon akajei TaxID=2704970 RepID=UPI003BF9B794